LTINVDTFPKKAPETAAWMGFANENERSSERSVGPTSSEWMLNPVLAGCGAAEVTVPDAGRNRHVVSSVLNKGVADAATACHAKNKAISIIRLDVKEE
jgi:hypothetical protein